MHHHLIAIPDTGYINVVGISDAGDALRALLEEWRRHSDVLCRNVMIVEI